jgi:hypothetical protein
MSSHLTNGYTREYHSNKLAMRRKSRGTLQIQEDVKRLFMVAKPLNVTSSDFLKGLLTSHAREVREAQLRTEKYAGLAALAAFSKAQEKTTVRATCLGRPPGAKDLQPRKRRTKRELARAKQEKNQV